MSIQTQFADADDFEPGILHRMDAESIRDSQKHLGHEPCFRSAKRHTCAIECQWRYQCRRIVAEWLREW